jgi:uncharacterized protein YybS (DUF2232 family)
VRNVHKLTEGALFLAAFAVLLLMTIYLPILGMAVNLFIALPFIMFAAKNDRKSSLVFLIGALFISFIVGTVFAIPLTISYGLTGLIIGDFIREKKNRLAGYIAGSIIFLLTLVVQYGISVAFFEMDIIGETTQMVEESVDQAFDMMGALGQEPNNQLREQFETSIDMMQVLIPSMFVMASFLMVLLMELVSFPIAQRFGIDVPKWKPFRELKLPKSLLWYYLLVLLASIAFNPEQGTYWYTAVINLSFILQFFMILQGLSFVYYLSHLKGWSKALPILITVFTFIFPILLYIVRILGIIDLGFDLRKRIELKK